MFDNLLNSLIWLSVAVVFVISFTLGWKLKRILWLFLPIILSLPISFGTWILAVNTPEMAKTGLGVIAVAPAVLIIIAFLNFCAALIGGVIGLISGRKRK